MENQRQTLCIPRVNTDISESHIRKTLEELNLGKIEGIDIVSRNKEKYNRVFVHLKWNNLENALLAREFLSSGKEIKVFYDEFWFWKISVYREPENRRKQKPKPKSKPDPKTYPNLTNVEIIDIK